MSLSTKINPLKFFPKRGIPLKTGQPNRIKKWPVKSQWKYFFRVFSKKEKIFFLIFFILAFCSFIFLTNNFYLKNTEVKAASGGTYKEGVIGQPRFINPIYANSDIDRDLVQLIFSGLMKYDENMEIVPDLAEKYEVSPDGKDYIFSLRKNILWQDKQPIEADDIIFTIKTIQNADTKSPLRANWVGVEIEKIDDRTIKFKLQKPYSAFLENCVLKILPKHIWKDIPAKNLPLENDYNLNPVGSGLYKLKELKRDSSGNVKSILLSQNKLYFGKKPNISKIEFLFFNNEEELSKAAKYEKIEGLSLNSLNQLGDGWQNYSLSFPRYFAVFFNQSKSKVLAEKNVRLALNYATDKKEIAKKVLGLQENSPNIDKAISQSPVLPKVYGFNPPSKIYGFDLQNAKEILEKAGFKENENSLREKHIQKERTFTFKKRLQKDSQGEEVKELQKCLANPALAGPEIYPFGEATGYFGEKTKQAVINFQEKYKKDILDPWNFTNGTGIVGKTTQEKLNEICFPAPEETLPLKFSLITVDQPQLLKVAEILKEQWKTAGVEVEIKKFPLSQLEQDFIKPRNYESLLLGEVLGAIPDPLPFWHSSQKNDPGLNLSLYENEKADELLEKNREASDPKTRREKLELFQNMVIEDAPAIFLYSPDYIYTISKEVKGVEVRKIVEPSNRFSGIENWYLKTKRQWK